MSLAAFLERGTLQQRTFVVVKDFSVAPFLTWLLLHGNKMGTETQAMMAGMTERHYISHLQFVWGIDAPLRHHILGYHALLMANNSTRNVPV